MPRHLFLPFILTLISCAGQNSALRESSVTSTPSSNGSYLPLAFHLTKAECIDSTYVLVGYTTSYPGKPLYRTDKLVYRVDVTISVDEGEYWDEQFGFACALLEGDTAYVMLNEEGMSMNDNLFNRIWFTVETRSKGWMRCTLCMIDSSGSEFLPVDENRPFRSATVHLD